MSPRGRGPADDLHGLPAGLLAWREYPVTLRSGMSIMLGFSLADPDHKTLVRLKRACEALHLGQLVVMGDPESQEEAVVWVHQSKALTLISQDDDDISISAEVAGILPRYFAMFFSEIKELAPGLAAVALIATRTGHEVVN